MQTKFPQRVLITGASQGLGLSIAKMFDNKQIKMLLTGRSANRLDQCFKEFSHPQYHESFVGDLLDSKYRSQLLQQIENNHIIPDVIIHNLGGKIDNDVQPLATDVLIKSIELNLGIAASINEYFLPLMARTGGGRIIHISSDASITGRSAPGYAAAKAAVNGYVKSTARFYISQNIMMCAVLPGIFEHEGGVWTQKKITQPEYYQQKIKEMPMGRFSHPDEIAEVVVDIACSSNIIYAGSLIELTAGLQ